MKKLAVFPSKYIATSSSVILVRPKIINQHSASNNQNRQSSSEKFDYQILLLKRNPKLAFGNFFAFPGGMVEKQDYVEDWQEQMPQFYSEIGFKFQDFAKRICVLRELFEETNLLMYKNSINTQNNALSEPTLSNYLTHNQSKFLPFNYSCGIRPEIEGLYGFQRLGSPIGFSPTNDTQFYLYFCDKSPNPEDIKMNEDEFTEYAWLSPDDALDLYQKNQLALFPPQVILISILSFMSTSYSSLKHMAIQMNSNILNYLTNKMQIFSLRDLEEKDLRKVVSQIFDHSDLQSDQDRSNESHILNFDELTKEIKELQSIGKTKTKEELYELCKSISIGLWYGDFHSPNDGYPLMNKQSQRRRLWYHQDLKVIRVELSKKIINDSLQAKSIVSTINDPKL